MQSNSLPTKKTHQTAADKWYAERRLGSDTNRAGTQYSKAQTDTCGKLATTRAFWLQTFYKSSRFLAPSSSSVLITGYLHGRAPSEKKNSHAVYWRYFGFAVAPANVDLKVCTYISRWFSFSASEMYITHAFRSFLFHTLAVSASISFAVSFNNSGLPHRMKNTFYIYVCVMYIHIYIYIHTYHCIILHVHICTISHCTDTYQSVQHIMMITDAGLKALLWWMLWSAGHWQSSIGTFNTHPYAIQK